MSEGPDMSWVSCSQCGVTYGLLAKHEEQLRKTGDNFYCPNGHSQHFGQSPQGKLDLLKRKLQGADARIANYRERVAHLTQRVNAFEGASKRRRKLRRQELKEGS